MRLYHATDNSAAEQIKNSRQFRCGRHGFAGGAIYFSKRKDGACRKYRNGRGNPDIIIECEVDLGRLVQAKPYEVSGQSQSIDSVKIKNLDVYAIYDPGRVEILSFENLRTGSVTLMLEEEWKQRRRLNLRQVEHRQEQLRTQREQKQWHFEKPRQEQQRQQQLCCERQLSQWRDENLRREEQQQQQQRQQNQREDVGGRSTWWSFLWNLFRRGI